MAIWSYFSFQRHLKSIESYLLFSEQKRSPVQLLLITWHICTSFYFATETHLLKQHVCKFMHMIPQVFYIVLTLKVPCISESCIEIKIKLDFYFHTSFWCIKRFYESTIKPFEAPQRSVKRKFNLIFSLCPGLRRKGLILIETYFHIRIFSYNLNYHHLSKVNWR